jgi:predicted alpha/beta superfamily hydrolase
MKLNPRLLLALVVLAASGWLGCSAADPNKVKITFIITVPPSTNEADVIHVCGGHPQLGDWNGKGLALARQSNGQHTGTLLLDRSPSRVEFKITRGSWETVEKALDGQEIANRAVELSGDRVERITVAAWRDQFEPRTRPSTITGDVRYHEEFSSKILNNSRKLIVWLPPDYEKDSSTRYPVLYMHDGQNLFDDATSFAGEWRADETATRLIAEGRIRPLIIVGIENAGPTRAEEYTPTTDTRVLRGQTITEGGNGAQYARFVVAEVKPFIDSKYRTLPDRANTAVCGSSLGGIITLYLGWKHTDVFGMCGVVSPSLWWDQRSMLVEFQTDNRWMRRTKIWLDMGTAEGSVIFPEGHIINARLMRSTMSRAGLKEGTDFKYFEAEGAGHNEQAWAERFDQVLLFLFGKP